MDRIRNNIHRQPYNEDALKDSRWHSNVRGSSLYLTSVTDNALTHKRLRDELELCPLKMNFSILALGCLTPSFLKADVECSIW